MLNPKSVADSFCKIETELCYLHGLLAAEERGTIAKKSGEAPNQQLKPKMPLLEEIQDAFAVDCSDTGHVTADEYAAIDFVYNYISRHFGH